MLRCDISSCKNFNEVYLEWGRIGAFRFEPFVAEADNGNMVVALSLMIFILYLQFK